MEKELKELIKVGKKTNKLLNRANWIILSTVIVNIITIVVIVWVILK